MSVQGTLIAVATFVDASPLQVTRICGTILEHLKLLGVQIISPFAKAQKHSAFIVSQATQTAPRTTVSSKQPTGFFTNRQTVRIVSQDDTLISLLKENASSASLVCSPIKQQEPRFLIAKIVPKGFGLATRVIMGAPLASLESIKTSKHKYLTRAFHV